MSLGGLAASSRLIEFVSDKLQFVDKQVSIRLLSNSEFFPAEATTN